MELIKRQYRKKDIILDQVEAMNLSSTLCNDSEITEAGNEIGDPTEVALFQICSKREVLTIRN